MEKFGETLITFPVPASNCRSGTAAAISAEIPCPPRRRAPALCVRRSIICLANRRKKIHGKRIFKSACTIASKLKLLPEPLDLLLRAFGGGDGGGKGWFRGGWGESDGGRQKLGVVAVGLVLSIALFLLFFDVELDFDGLLGWFLLGVSVRSWRKGCLDWLLGFFCCGFLVRWLMRKEIVMGIELMKKNGIKGINRRRTHKH